MDNWAISTENLAYNDFEHMLITWIIPVIGVFSAKILFEKIIAIFSQKNKHFIIRLTSVS